MLFRDRFILALYFGLAQHLPAGRDAALRILDRAIDRGRLALADLNDTSLLLLLTLLPETSPHRPTVVGFSTARGLHADPARLIRLLRAAAPPRLTEIVEVSRPPGWQLRQLVINALCAPNELGMIEDLSLYLSRHYLLDPTGIRLRDLAEGLITEAIRRFVRIPLGTVDFLPWLYRVSRHQTLSPRLPPPTAFPAGARPAWFLALDPDEQRFIDYCLLYLPLPDVDMLYLHVYARLTVEQIAFALHRAQPGAASAILQQLATCWYAVL